MFTEFFNQFSATVTAKSQLDRYEIIYFHKIWIKCNHLGKNHASGTLNSKFIRYKISKLFKFQGTKAQMGTIFGFWIFFRLGTHLYMLLFPSVLCLFVRPSICLSVCLSVCPSVCPSIHPSNHRDHISGTLYDVIIIFGPMCKMIIFPSVFSLR